MREQPWNLYAPGMWNSVKAVIASLIGARHRFALFCIDSEISIALPRGQEIDSTHSSHLGKY